jgi:hypothetical protein
MSKILQCRKDETKQRIADLTRIRKENNPPDQPAVKEMDVVDELIEKGFQHPSIVKELKHHNEG